MPAVFPFRAVQYNKGRGDVSTRVAPPYDVLSAAQKSALLKKDPANIVAVDLPHVPAKELGPPEAYATAADLYESWLEDGTLRRRDTPAMFAYRQTFAVDGARYERTGMAAALETRPLGPRDGGGVLPHEQTFSGPKEDRLALMRETQAQLSPIFGLHQDAQGRATEVVRGVTRSRPADMTADLGDGVTHEVWTVDDGATIAAYAAALAGEDVFIADGHHRYNTAVNYLKSLTDAGKVSTDHPARRTMFVLVGMSDPGLYIGPTHRVLGGMKNYSKDALLRALAEHFDVATHPADLPALERHLLGVPATACALGLLDVSSGACFVATPKAADPLARGFPDQCEAWRRLDVAIIQHVLVDAVCKPLLNDGDDVRWAFPHTVAEVAEIASGAETGAGGGGGFAQLAVIVRPTPLAAVRDVSRAGGLMPQKSTFFFPKLATGLFINPLA